MAKKAEDPTTPIAYGYVRVSTFGQHRSGLSLSEQKRQIYQYYETYLKPRGFRWAGGDQKEEGCYQDSIVSGGVSLHKRLHGSLLWTRVRRGDAVITAKLDRMFRDTGDAVKTIDRWWREKIELHAISERMALCDENPFAKPLMCIMSIFADMEKQRISERHRERVAVYRRLGRPITTARYGFVIKGKPRQHYYEHNYPQREAAQRALKLLASTAPGPLMSARAKIRWTVSSVARKFDEERLLGKRWDHCKVKAWIAKERRLQAREAALKRAGLAITPEHLLSDDPELLKRIAGPSTSPARIQQLIEQRVLPVGYQPHIGAAPTAWSMEEDH